MGCGVSKFDANGTTFPQRIFSVFHGHVEDVKRRQPQTLKDDKPSSKKVLLSRGRDDYHDNASSHQPLVNNTKKKNSSLLDEDIDGCDTFERDLEKRMNGNSQRDDPFSTMKHQNNEARREARSMNDESSIHFRKDYEHEGQSSKAITKENSNMNKGFDANIKEEREDDEDDDDDSDDERKLKRDDEYDFPGSPSFRVYFAEKSQDQMDNDEDNNGLKEAPPSEAINEDISNGLKETTTPGEAFPIQKESIPQEVKKGRKRKGLKQVLPKGRRFNKRS